MTIMEMLAQSGILTVLGMGVVFGFLLIMIIAVILSGKAIHALGLDSDVAPQIPVSSEPASAPSASRGVTAAISAAVNEYRKNENK